MPADFKISRSQKGQVTKVIHTHFSSFVEENPTVFHSESPEADEESPYLKAQLVRIIILGCFSRMGGSA